MYEYLPKITAQHIGGLSMGSYDLSNFNYFHYLIMLVDLFYIPLTAPHCLLNQFLSSALSLATYHSYVISNVHFANNHCKIILKFVSVNPTHFISGYCHFTLKFRYIFHVFFFVNYFKCSIESSVQLISVLSLLFLQYNSVSEL